MKLIVHRIFIIGTIVYPYASYSMEHNYQLQIKHILDETHNDINFITQKINDAKKLKYTHQDYMPTLYSCKPSINQIEYNMKQLNDIFNKAHSDCTIQQHLCTAATDYQRSISQLYALVISAMNDLNTLRSQLT